MSLLILNLRSTLRTDPSRTTTLRKRYMGEMRRRFATVRARAVKAIVELDVLGLKEPKQFTFHSASPAIHALPEREAFRFLTKPEKVKAFNSWFQQQIDQEILTTTATGNPWTAKYVHSAYKQGSLRAYMDVRPEAMEESLSFYKGRREQFLESAFNQPERLDKLRLLYSRSFEDLKGITNAMSQQINRLMADGISQGLHPTTIARNLAKNVNTITKTRALVMARTEVIHAHSEGQLDSFEDLGVKEVGVMAEWSTAGDDRVCPECGALEGTVMTVAEARGLIPRHPNCRCAWIPANVGEKEARQKRFWTQLDKKKRINKSLMAGLPKRTAAGVKVPQTVKEAKRRSTWPGKHLKPVKPPAGVDLAPPLPRPKPKPKPKPKPVPKPKPETGEELTSIRHTAPRKKDVAALEEKLTTSRKNVDHSMVVHKEQLLGDPDATGILKKGQYSADLRYLTSYGKKEHFKLVAMEEGECHWNVAKLFKKGKVDRVVTGYVEHYNSTMRMTTWRQHTWGLKDGKIIETTAENFELATRYYGATLSESASGDFAKWALDPSHAPGEGMVRSALKTATKGTSLN